MPSKYEQGRVAVKYLIEHGTTSTKSLMNLTKVSMSTVQRVKARMRAGEGTEDRNRSGRPRKRSSTFRRMLGQIKSTMKYAPARALADEIKKRNKPIVSVSTIQRALH